LVDVARARSSNSLVSNNDPKQHQVAYAGAFNSVSGKKENDISLVHQYVVVYPKNAKFKWSMYNSILAIMSTGCTGIGILKAIDGGLACQKCIDLHASKGTANPSVFLNKWSYSIKKFIKHCTKDALTEIDIKDAKHFLHCSDRSFNEKGKAFKKENAAQVEYAKRMSMLAKSLPIGSINVVTPESVPSPKSFFLIAHELYLNNPTFNKSILTAMMHSMVTQMTNPTKSLKMEPRALNFFHYLATVSPQAAELVSANLGSAPSKRWMRILNARERVVCV
jgi:hypothetical protein